MSMKFLLTVSQKGKEDSYFYKHVDFTFDNSQAAASAIDSLLPHMPKDKDTDFTITTIREDESNDDI